MLEESRIRAGHWEGVWTGPADPALTVSHLGQDLPGLSCTPIEGGSWRLDLPIPVELLSDGIQTFLVRAGTETVGTFTIVAGQPLDEDLRAEIELLRAELDLLKRAFRRHCAETAG